MYTCKICNKEFESPLYEAHEVRFGWGDAFDYVKCPHCNCVQIKDIPTDLGKYYSADYYSLKADAIGNNHSKMLAWLRKHLLQYKIDSKHRDVIGRIMSICNKQAFDWIESGYFGFNSSILDVGCGRTIIKLAESGFTNVQGIEPYLQSDITYRINGQNVQIHKQEITEITGQFDVITLTHVMEHLDKPHEALEALSKNMHENSVLILTLPLFSNFTWEHYGIEAHQFTDAPRHLFIYSLNSLCQLAAQHHLRLVHSKFYYYYKILLNVYGRMSSDIQQMDQKRLVKELLKTNDSGHAYLYFQLNK